MKYFYCQDDGGQWNVPVVMEHDLGYGLCVIRALTSDLVGRIGRDGHMYALVAKRELYDIEQSNVISLTR